MAGQRQDGTPLAEAADTLGLSPEAARKRLQRGTLDGYKVDNQWYVVLPRQDAPSGQMAGRQDADRPEPIQPPPVTPAEVERAIAATAGRYMADFAGLYERISADVGARYQAEVAAKDETIAELRRRAELAEAALGAASAPPASPAPPGSEAALPASDSTPVAPGGAQGLRAWLRRAFGGEG